MVHKDLLHWLRTRLLDGIYIVYNGISAMDLLNLVMAENKGLVSYGGRADSGAMRYTLTPQGEIALGIVASEDGTPEAGSDEPIALNAAMLSLLRLVAEHSDGHNGVEFDSGWNFVAQQLIEYGLIIRPIAKHLHITKKGMQWLEENTAPTNAPATPDTSDTEAGYTVDKTDYHYLLSPTGERLQFFRDEWYVDVVAQLLNAETRTLREQVARLQAELVGARRELEISRLARQALEKVIWNAHNRLTDGRLKDYDAVALAKEILEPYTGD